jgi:hypothetical protein
LELKFGILVLFIFLFATHLEVPIPLGVSGLSLEEAS